MSLTVRGGTEGIAAHLDDLLAVAVQFDRAADDTDALVAYAGSWLVRAEIDSCPLPLAWALDDILDSLRSHWSLPRLAAQALRSSAARLRLAAQLYEQQDDGVLADLGHLVGHAARVAGAVGDGIGTFFVTGSAGAAAQRVLTTDPELVDAAAELTLFTGFEQDAGRRYPDGHPVVTDLGTDLLATSAPHNLTDLVDQLADRNDTASGEISVGFVVGADGRRRAIVDLPGTKSWSAGPSEDVTSLSTNARALVGASTSYERGVLDAMSEAGVRSTDPVLLVGHSEGGLVAVTTARDALASGRFDVTNVVTAGAPIGRTVGTLPESVRVLALENDNDVVPDLDARDNPDAPNVTTVGFVHDLGSVGENHDLRDSYAFGAALCDTDDDPSIRAFTDSAEGFLDGSSEDTRLFVITRGY